jgi:myo-inositol-1(or 4)-monophosphatase
MEERLKSELTKATMEAGLYAKAAAGRRNRLAVSEVERKIRQRISGRIKVADPQISVWGEQRAPEDNRVLHVSGIDSVINFTRNLGEYSIMSTIYEECLPVFGAIYFPQNENIMTAEAGKGVRINGRRVEVSQSVDLSKVVVCFNFSTSDQDMAPVGFDMLERMMRRFPAWRVLGSPGKEFRMVCEGRIDALVVGFAESDNGAGYLAMKEAGAVVTDRNGKPFSSSSREIVAANPILHEELIELINQ